MVRVAGPTDSQQFIKFLLDQLLLTYFIWVQRHPRSALPLLYYCFHIRIAQNDTYLFKVRLDTSNLFSKLTSVSN